MRNLEAYMKGFGGEEVKDFKVFLLNFRGDKGFYKFHFQSFSSEFLGVKIEDPKRCYIF